MGTGNGKGVERVNAPCQEVLEKKPSRALQVATRCDGSSKGYKELVHAAMIDSLDGSLAPRLASGIVSGVRTIVRVVEAELRYSEQLQRCADGGLNLLDGPCPPAAEDQEIAALEALLAEKKAARAKVVS